MQPAARLRFALPTLYPGRVRHSRKNARRALAPRLLFFIAAGVAMNLQELSSRTDIIREQIRQKRQELEAGYIYPYRIP